ncbi:hypothetical protein M3S04_03950 [Xanthomonas sp. PPL139]|uniref:hypothetical protein n=1 Tax=unclassified Xanthomonas TaxID=2643310 RepID=UPI0033BC37A9
MSNTVKLATARELAAAGSVRDTVLVGKEGGYVVLFKIGMQERTLATKDGAPRLFSGLDAAVRVLRGQLGIAHYHVDASGFAIGEATRRRRPDRAAALKRTYADAAYLSHLQERADAGRRDPVRFTNDQAREKVRLLREGLGS